MELSSLATFDGSLLAVGDKTGVLFKFVEDMHVVPWVILPHKDGKVPNFGRGAGTII